jgi:hypothetical protein
MTSMFTRALGVVLALGSAALLSTAGEDKEVVGTINKQADAVGKMDWKALSGQGDALAKKHELTDIMNIMKPRNSPGKVKGVGIGPKPGAITPDGIDAKIIKMSNLLLPPATLDMEQKDLIRMAQITAAIASVSVHQCTVEKKMGDKDPAKWKEWMELMNSSSLELIDALNKKNPDAVRVAAKKLRSSCTECHSVFRD